MISKSELQDGKYYKGICRNASTAIWDKESNSFWYNRRKMGSVYPEKLPTYEDRVDQLDYFLPLEPVEPTSDEMMVKEAVYSSFVLKRH